MTDRQGSTLAERSRWGDETGPAAFAGIRAAIARGSPFLSRLIEADADRVDRFASTPPEHAIGEIVAAQAALGPRFVAGDLSREDTARDLRRNRADQALLVALAEIGRVWPVERVTEALTAFADASVRTAVAVAVAEAAAAGRVDLAAIGPEGEGCGLVVLALGKHGAGELNYSSDIDLVLFFDPRAAALPPGSEAGRTYNRIAQGIVRLLSERSEFGYVHRVDYRLRPDPASTNAAVSLPSAYSYYETVGQNWERAAMIKARPVAGDLALGARFLADLEPFIWRKYFDFGSIADIHAMKRQIHAVRGYGEIAVAGHDIKLGRGGIREIEFFVQTQQLVFGGKRRALRGRRTLEMLAMLQSDGWITEAARDELSEAYRFLRTVEHRIQMVADEQTQRLPAREDDLARFAAFAGFPGVPEFGAALTAEARLVQRHYARLFEDAPDLASEAGDLVFTGVEDDPATLATLGRLGFADPARAAETVRGWHFGRRAAITSPRAREVLTDLVPPLLKALGGSADPDGALARLDTAFSRMPAAVELLSILRQHERLRLLFADLLGTAPRLADEVAAKPHVLDVVIDPGFATPARGEAEIEADLRALVGHPAGTEEFLDASRDAVHQLQFLTGARLLSGVLSPAEAGSACADLAGAAIRLALERVSAAFATDHGHVPGGRVAVLALGRLGARDLTATSDLDLVCVYDFDPLARASDGPKPLDAVVYFTRLTQRLISALTVPTRRGRLFAVDMRLRPSGTKGPLASQLSGFVAYHAEAAELWEHMALARARAIAGDADLGREVEAIVGGILRRKRDPARVYREVRAMRALVEAEKPANGGADLKLAPGGLLDLDFLAQALTLAHAHLHPDLVGRGTAAVLAAAGQSGLLPSGEAEATAAAFRTLDDVLHWQRLTMGPALGGSSPALARLAGAPDSAALAFYLAETMRPVREIFDRVLGG